MSKGKLVLENGVIFEGTLFGYKGNASGEVVFNTSLTGYQEILTDPSYSGQVIIMTYPLIGNYGVNETDIESEKIQAAGLVVGNYEDEWSNYEGSHSLDNYLKKFRITGIFGIDTRALTKMIRSEGAMKGIISDDSSSDKNLLEKVLKSPSMSGLDLVKKVTTPNSYTLKSKKPKYRIAVYDFGIKKNILREFLKFNTELKIFSADADHREVLDYKPHGIFLSNGPGDPGAVSYAIENIKNLIPTKIPIFGICLGHQLIAHALEGKTYKLKFGHRGGNHPVKNLDKNRIEITAQNHGFAVDENSLNTETVKITHTNLYDNTNEGLRHRKFPVMSVQYHPEASPGPNDSKYLFEEFMSIVQK
ncbi:MAG: glutamine-hydrolyzing carbamoyl-phosphate synthase small subunit [Ignavibacteria bacterium]|nr:glutamine-hydrolyzing carbamoyl-phosphate synthase small subunit [Ignavibacteria bacterium]